MGDKYILFLSTNLIWGGSEVLWTQSAKAFAAKGCKVRAGFFYEFEFADQYMNSKADFVDLAYKPTPLHFLQRVIQKLGLAKFPVKNILHEDFKNICPDLVVISQGNNIDGKVFMEDCILFNIPFVTITQLVTLDFWPALNDKIINKLRFLYRQAKANYFVSTNTLLQHERLLAERFHNNVIVYNPFTKEYPSCINFPVLEDGIYKVALVGRIETFHKGYDLLIDILKQEKWKTRPVQFSVFGTGPHIELLQRTIKLNKIENISFNGHSHKIDEVWKKHHILLMPSRMEGQSLSLIEAMRFSRAAIVTDVGGTNELIDDGVNGFIARYPLPEFIDDALERAWERRDEWEQLGINAAKAIAQKHPADAVSFFNNQIEKVLSENDEFLEKHK